MKYDSLRELEKHPKKTFTGRIGRLFDVLGCYHFSQGLPWEGDEIGCRTQVIGFGTLRVQERVQEYSHQEIAGECRREPE